MAKKTLKQSFEEAKAYLLSESNKVLPFTIKDGREWPKIDNDYMCESFLNGCSKVVIRNYPNYKPTERRTMKQVKADFNKNLQKHSLSKTKRK